MILKAQAEGKHVDPEVMALGDYKADIKLQALETEY